MQKSHQHPTLLSGREKLAFAGRYRPRIDEVNVGDLSEASAPAARARGENRDD
jgi:hypothetical protein